MSLPPKKSRFGRRKRRRRRRRRSQFPLLPPCFLRESVVCVQAAFLSYLLTPVSPTISFTAHLIAFSFPLLPWHEWRKRPRYRKCLPYPTTHRFPFNSEHCRPGGLRPPQDPWHGILRQGHAGAAQGAEGLLRNEDTRQAEGKRTFKNSNSK